MNDRQISRYPLNKEGYIQQYVLTRAKDKSGNFNVQKVIKEANDSYNVIQTCLD